MSRSCLGLVSVFFWWCLSVLFWCCFVVLLVVFWGCFSDVLVTSRACFGEVSMMCGDGSVMFMMMSGWWLAVVSFLFLWWWCFDFLMNIDEHFDRVSKQISNSNLNLYIVHLWANQCSCGSYVVGWCFKCFDVLVTSRACFGEISVMCVDGAVMFKMMSGWCLGVVSLMLQCCFFSLVMMFWFSDEHWWTFWSGF